MEKRLCLDCKKDISNRRWMAKRCEECSHKRGLEQQKNFRDTHKKEIREYQKNYYNKKPNNSNT